MLIVSCTMKTTKTVSLVKIANLAFQIIFVIVIWNTLEISSIYTINNLKAAFDVPKWNIFIRITGQQIIYTVSALATLWIADRFFVKRTFKSYGLARKGCLALFSSGFFGGFVFYLFIILLSIVVVRFEIKNSSQDYNLLHIFFLYFLVALSEEIIFRGYIFQVSESYFSTSHAIIISAFTFSLLHSVMTVLNGEVEQSVSQFIIMFSSGTLFASCYLVSRSLWLPIGVHCGANMAYFLFQGDFGLAPLYKGFLSTKESIVILYIVETLIAALILFITYRTGRWHSVRAT